MPKLNDSNPNDFPYRIKLPEGLTTSLVETAQQITKIYRNLYTDEIQRAAKNAIKAQQQLVQSLNLINTERILEGVRKIAEAAAQSVKRLDVHLPDNWPQSLSNVADLCIKGIPVIFVPRAEIIAEMLKAKDTPSIKRLLVRKAPEVLEDCEKALNECTWLTKDMREHIQESIDCYRHGQHRAAQSTATIAFDVLLNDVVDMRIVRNKNKRVLSSTIVRDYTDLGSDVDLMQLPLGGVPFYTLLMFPVIGRMLSYFSIGDKTTYVNDANRHQATHTVSSKQYKKSNAILTIMTVASICKVTELNGKYWIQKATDYYQFEPTKRTLKK